MSDVGPVQMWKASDGSFHETEEAWKAHEDSLTEAKEVERYIASKDWGRGQDTRARALLLDFLKSRSAE